MEKRAKCLFETCKREQKKRNKYCGYHHYLEGMQKVVKFDGVMGESTFTDEPKKEEPTIDNK